MAKKKTSKKKTATKKKVTKKTSTKNKTAKKADSGKKSGSKSKKIAKPKKDPAVREFMIAEAAYYRWEQSGHMAGLELEHWLQAEQDIDRMLNG